MSLDLESVATPKAVGILGMHRSGTSCLSGCLEERGLYLGVVSNSAPNNLKGNKENLEFRAINDVVLAMSGGSWDLPPESLVWDNELRDRRDACIAQYPSSETWGFKDPRTLLTVPFWEEAGIVINWVGTFRHPACVAASLAARPRLKPATPNLDLWKAYNQKLLQYAQEFQMPIICFDLPGDVYLATVQKMANHLGLKKSSPSEAEFFEETLRHRHFEDPSNDQCSAEYIDLYNELLSHALVA
ncbi:MAG: sulfotransferase family protein [Litorimonas sp.]